MSSAEAALVHLCERRRPTALLVADADLPGPMNGLALSRNVTVLWPSTSVIVTSQTPREQLPALPDGGRSTSPSPGDRSTS